MTENPSEVIVSPGGQPPDVAKYLRILQWVSVGCAAMLMLLFLWVVEGVASLYGLRGAFEQLSGVYMVYTILRAGLFMGAFVILRTGRDPLIAVILLVVGGILTLPMGLIPIGFAVWSIKKAGGVAPSPK